MVFTTAIQMIRSRGPDEFWRKRKVFKMSSHYFGRARNCYSIAIRIVHRSLAYATKGRLLKKKDMRQLWEQRIEGACDQQHLPVRHFYQGLARTNIQLNKKVMSELAAFEPHTFKALTEIAADNYNREDIK